MRETRLWDADAGQSRDDARARRRRTTTATSPIPICRRSSSTGRRWRAILRTLPELPAARFERYQREHGLAADDARTLVGERALADYFDAALAAHPGDRTARARSRTGC